MVWKDLAKQRFHPRPGVSVAFFPKKCKHGHEQRAVRKRSYWSTAMLVRLHTEGFSQFMTNTFFQKELDNHNELTILNLNIMWFYFTGYTGYILSKYILTLYRSRWPTQIWNAYKQKKGYSCCFRRCELSSFDLLTTYLPNSAAAINSAHT